MSGRPAIGAEVKVRLPPLMVVALDARATAAGIKRAEMIRQLLATALVGPGDEHPMRSYAHPKRVAGTA